MTLSEFQNRYYMHDSYFDSIEYNEKEKSVDMIINFAYWMQEWYEDGKPENGLLSCSFYDVSIYDYSGDEIDYNMVSILKTEVADNTIVFALGDDINDEYYELKITAKSVQVKEYIEG